MTQKITILAAVLLCGSLPTIARQAVPMKFDFGPGKVQSGYTQILPETLYSADKGYGFWPGAVLTATDSGKGSALESDYISSSKPFYFSVALADGNYDVTVTFGDKNGTSSQILRAECRRLLLPSFETAAGEVRKETFTVHMRGINIGKDGKKVLINPREVNFFHWDNQFTFEFAGKDVKVCSIAITPNTKATTIFLAGNSTVVDQDKDPWGAWGQMIAPFFQPGKIAIANYAESGETFLAFEKEQRLEKIWSMARPGDYLFMEFAHNDMKAGPNYLEPFTTYKAKFKEWINLARAKGLHPVIVTSMGRKGDITGKEPSSLKDYPEAARQAGKENNVPVIDLNAMSRAMYTAWGPADVGKGFVDGTHANVYGAWELARCMVEGIRANVPDLAKSLKPGLAVFDPTHPDPFDAVNWPLSVQGPGSKPPGN